MFSPLSLDRWRPRYELETQPFIDHGETTGRERETLPVDASDVITVRGLRERKTCLGGESHAGGGVEIL